VDDVGKRVVGGRDQSHPYTVGVAFMRPEKKAGPPMKLDSSNLPKRKNIRLKHYDYSSDGYYFVTICSHGRQAVFEKNDKIIEAGLSDLPRRFPGVTIDYYVLMPSHIHIIFVLQGTKVPLWEVVRAFKALVTRRSGEKKVWQRGYYEHAIRNEEALFKIRQYIQNNPLAARIEFERFYESGLDESSPYEPNL
jgi:putative transposase